MGDRMGSSPIDRTKKREVYNLSFLLSGIIVKIAGIEVPAVLESLETFIPPFRGYFIRDSI